MMKKLVIMLGVAAAAVAATAATVSWGTEAFYIPTGEDGEYSTDSKTASGSVHGYLWEVNQETYNKFATDLASVYTEFAKTSHGTLGNATADGTNAGMGRNLSLAGTTSWSESSTAYGILLYTYNDGEKDWYVANAAKFADMGPTDATVSKLNLYVGGYIDGAAQGAEITGWSTASVPEPFSGTLVLVGMAGLALRRKLKKQKKA